MWKRPTAVRVLRSDLAWLCVLAGSASLAGHAAAAPVAKAPGTYGLLGIVTLDPGVETLTVGPGSSLYGVGTDGSVVIRYTAGGGYVTAWGGDGRRPGQFDDASGVATDAAGNVYVADTGNDRIQKFTATGAFLDQWGNPGTDPGEFSGPQDVATDAAGNVYVADTGNDRVQSFTPGGAFLDQWGQGTYQNPTDLTVDAAGTVYVLSSALPRITRSDTTGAGISSWGAPGTGKGQWNSAQGISSANGQVFLGDLGNDRVQVFLPSGSFLSQFPLGGQGDLAWLADVAAGQQGRVYTTQTFADISGLSTYKVIAGFSHLLKQKYDDLTVGVATADLGAEISLRGRALVSPRGSSKAGRRFGLRAKTVTLAANQTRDVKLRFRRKKALPRLERRLKNGKEVSATVTATATEAGGAVTTQDLVIQLRR